MEEAFAAESATLQLPTNLHLAPEDTFNSAARLWLSNVGVDIEVPCSVRKFLNRLLGLETMKQNLLFEAS